MMPTSAVPNFCFRKLLRSFPCLQIMQDIRYVVKNGGIMEIITERLIIRELCKADYPEFERTLNDVQKTCFGSGKGFLNWLIAQYSTMDIINGVISFGIFEKVFGKLMGTIGVGKHDDLHEPEIFYSLLAEYRGYGYASEAVKEVTEWALNNYNIPYLIGTVAVDNVKSQHVLERCGYQFVATRSLLIHATNERCDFRYYRYYNTKYK